MTGTTHALFAGSAAFGLLLAVRGEPEVVLLGTSMALIGSLAPDIDHPHSRAANSLGIFTRAGARLVNTAFGHRGMLHSALAAFATALWAFLGLHLIGLTDDLVAVGGLMTCFGYLTHLLLDWSTPAGIPFLWPSKRRYHSFMTGRSAIFESVFVIAALSFATAVFLSMRPVL